MQIIYGFEPKNGDGFVCVQSIGGVDSLKKGVPRQFAMFSFYALKNYGGIFSGATK